MRKTHVNNVILSKIYELFQITIGAFLMGAALSIFLVPLKIASGGVSGLATVLHYVTGMRTGFLIILINVPILILGFWAFDIKFILRSLYGTVMLSLSTELMSFISAPTQDMLLACAFGGVIMGLGIAQVLKSNGTTGGVDILVLVFRKYMPLLSVGKLFLIIDGIIIFIAGAVFKSWETVLYSAVGLFISTYVTDLVLEGLKFARLVYIMSEKSSEITQKIYSEMERGVTSLSSVSMYTGKGNRILLCAIRKTELTKLKRLVYTTDPNAFVIISDAKEVLGNGFELKSNHI